MYCLVAASLILITREIMLEDLVQRAFYFTDWRRKVRLIRLRVFDFRLDNRQINNTLLVFRNSPAEIFSPPAVTFLVGLCTNLKLS